MKNLFLPLSLFFLVFSASAQVDFGIKAGLNFSNIEYNIRGTSAEGRTGVHVGTLVDFSLSEKFHLQPEILYSTEGIDEGGIDYLNIPVTLKWFFYDNIHLNAGPQLGIVLDAEGGTQGLNKTNFAGVFGLGYEAPGGFMVDTRYSLGLSNIVDKDLTIDSGMGYMISGIRAWTRAFQLSIGYKF